jgi:hypothetical protein
MHLCSFYFQELMPLLELLLPHSPFPLLKELLLVNKMQYAK